jgi:transposase
MRVPVHLQREAARLHFYDLSQSSRAIARSTGLSTSTVLALRAKLRSSGKDWLALQSLDDDAWCVTLGTENRAALAVKPVPDWAWVHDQMQLADATLERLWREWREACPQGIAYSQFTSLYRQWCKSQHVVMRRTHRPGDKLFVDFAGRTVEIRDPEGGPSSLAQIFIAVLGCSNYTYIEALPSQTTPDWVLAHVHAFQALGGVPHWVVPDNLKAAVWRRERERVVLNPAYVECLRHYDTAPLPAGAYKPRHKAKVEVGVQIAQRWVLFALRDRVFFSIAELNHELVRLTALLNAHPFKRLPGCRRERFEKLDQPALKPLPAVVFALRDWRYGVRVQSDHHVEHGRCYYSVPHHLVHERVDLCVAGQTLEVFHRGRRVALHPLLSTTGESATVPEHRPLAHRRVLEGEPQLLQAWAVKAGPNAALMIEHHLLKRHDAANGLKAAQRLRNLAQHYGDERFEQVCAYALPLNITTLRGVTSILKEEADLRARQVLPKAPSVVGEVRGADYYREPA